ncbi:hypothetical protein [Maritimibacter sp. DP1N21-5]|uniref:hypothetical protein n=1 Tax=Maritimibacter sp. DP1N21-5 TaxID=2836867 RepID=UPI001C479DAE|nr:hypothetical protein [Maritimibacter sp. DP1N21-5]MBV7410972.1 hypothetical protein [Maritimibacter sp. DP1N21-5]
MTRILNRLLHTGSHLSAGIETHFEREYHIRHEDLVRRRDAEAELHRQLRRRINL